MKKWTQIRTRPLRALLVGAGISAAAFMASTVISAPPPANAVIGNQASATYVDLAGVSQAVQSNLVTTTVAQVRSVDVTPTNTLSDPDHLTEKSALAGNTVYIPHSVINTGNGTDIFRIEVDGSTSTSKYTNIAIYPDANGTGIPSSTTPLCSDAGTPKCSDGFLQSLPAGEQFNFVIAYTVPTNATVGTVDTTTITATSTTSSTATDFATDKISVVTGAVFSATKAVKVPGVAAATVAVTPPVTTDWPKAVTVGVPSAATGCSTDWTTTKTIATNCNYTTYTVSFTNTGGAAGTFTMQDKLPSGLTYVQGTAIYSGAGGNALPDGSIASTEGKVTSSYDSASTTFKASVADVGVNVSGTVSFVVLINSNAKSDNNDASTTNVAKYWSTGCDPINPTAPNDCGGSTTPGGEPPVSTNPSPIPVADTFGVIAADNNGTGNTADGTKPTNKTTDTPDDKNLIIVPSVEQGGKATFTNYVSNAGSTTDTFNVSVPATGADNNFPAGTTFSFYKADGVTPLTDTNNDGKLDTGPVAPGAPAVAIVMVATLPSNAPITTDDSFALFTATSVKDPSKSDYVWNVVSAVVAPTSKVDLTNTPTGNKTSTNGGTDLVDCVAGSNCDLGQGPSTTPTFTDTTQPGVTVDFPVFIDNNTGASGTFDLTVPSLPPGWTATFTTDATCPGTPITSVTLASGEQDKKVLACITPPPGTPAGTTNVDIVVTKQGDPTVTDTLRDAVTVTSPTDKPDMQLGPDSGTPKVNTGGTVDQPTTLTNTGTTSCGTAATGLKATLTVTGATAGWTASLYYDRNSNGIVDADDVAQTELFTAGTPNVFKLTDTTLTGTLAPLHNVPLATGKTLPLLVKIFAPSGAPKGEIGTATLVVDSGVAAGATGYCPADTATFNATVLVGQVRVYKTQAYLDTNTDCSTVSSAGTGDYKADAISIKPNPSVKQCIVYKVVAVNEGDAPVKNVALSDVVPSYTVFATKVETTDPEPQPALANRCAVVNGTGTVAFAPASPTAATKVLSCGTVTELQPGGTLTMMFTVMLEK